MAYLVGVDPEPTHLIEALRIIADHATACADELEALATRNAAERENDKRTDSDQVA